VELMPTRNRTSQEQWTCPKKVPKRQFAQPTCHS